MKRLLLRLAATASLVAAATAPAAAHEKWFFNAAGHPLRWDLFFRPLPLALAGAVTIATLVATIVWRARGERGFLPGPSVFGATARGKSILYGLLPLIIGVHCAVPLLVDGTETRLFSPNDTMTSAPAYIVGVCETFVALSFFYGGLTRISAVLLAAIWFASFWIVGPEATLENTLFLGVAVFFFMTGRGPLSIDRLLLPNLEPPAWLVRNSVIPLRIGLGISLTVVAFTEKLANQPLALDFLKTHPLNFTAALGLPLSNELFVLCAGSVELIIGLWITLGIFNREIVIIALLPFNLTLSVFNQTELAGHLPFYGIMALLLVWETGSENRREWLAGVSGNVEVKGVAVVDPALR
jgi:uncharacterized membrane protein YphA (DoxX/SURF4 family)